MTASLEAGTAAPATGTTLESVLGIVIGTFVAVAIGSMFILFIVIYTT